MHIASYDWDGNISCYAVHAKDRWPYSLKGVIKNTWWDYWAPPTFAAKHATFYSEAEDHHHRHRPMRIWQTQKSTFAWGNLVSSTTKFAEPNKNRWSHGIILFSHVALQRLKLLRPRRCYAALASTAYGVHQQPSLRCSSCHVRLPPTPCPAAPPLGQSLPETAANHIKQGIKWRSGRHGHPFGNESLPRPHKEHDFSWT